MTASDFPTALAFTLRYEGGRANNPRDPGGRTNEGVTQRTFTAWLARQGQSARDVYGMTPAERDAIYRGGYWDAVKGDTLPDGVDLAVFDYGVNSGPSRARKAWTRRASNDATAGVQAICAGRLSFDRGLAIWNTFRRGWTARVAACEALGIKMAEHARIGVAVDAPATVGTAAKLLVESKAAEARASGHKAKAVGTATVTGAAGVTQGPAMRSAHLPVAAIVVTAIGAALVVAFFVWRAHQQQARAVALEAVAREAVAAATPIARPAAAA